MPVDSSAGALHDSVCPNRRPDVSSYEILDEAVLYDPLRSQIYAINNSAKTVWHMCDGATSLFQMAQKLSLTVDLSLEALLQQIKDAILNFYRLDLLQHSTADSNPAGILAQRKIREIWIGFEDRRVLIHTDEAELAERLASLFDAMIVQGGESYVRKLGVYNMGKGYTVSGTRSLHLREGTLNEALKVLKHEVVINLIEACPEFIWLHAGAVSGDQGAIMFAGPWASGKSTFTSALYQRGWYYYSDDIIPYAPGTGHIIPFPLTPAIRSSSEKELTKMQLTTLSKKSLKLEADRIGSSSAIDVLIFPHYRSGSENKLVPISPGTAAVELIQQCQNIEFHLENAISALGHLVATIPAFRLDYDNTELALASLDSEYNKSAHLQ